MQLCELSVLKINLQLNSIMYPSLGPPNPAQISFKKQVPPSQAMTNSILELTKSFTMASFKPHLSYHECHMSLTVNNKTQYPLKIVFFRNYPKEKPVVYATKWVMHPIVNKSTCQIDYQQIFKWSQTSKLVQLIRKLQQQFSTRPPIQKSQLQLASTQLDDYLKQVQSLRNKPPGTQPPPPPQINLQSVLNAFQQQQHLKSQCDSKNQMYLMAAQEYAENVSRVRCISQRFSRGRILRELEKELERQVEEGEHSGIDDVLKKYYEARKKFHRIKILKELYLEE